ncbi:MAG: RHS repeat-associated core domain-containing protein [Deltaproteobacteria bacterium]|nr:RHS repeat-associated core domain-containing protein [Deltaproteobacteria bacterium]
MPFGKERYVLNPALKGVGPKFTSQTQDEEDGLYFYKSRYYDHVLGRFIQPDALILADASNPQTLNSYSYVLNNPLKYTDPTGHRIFIPIDDGRHEQPDSPWEVGREPREGRDWAGNESNFDHAEGTTVGQKWNDSSALSNNARGLMSGFGSVTGSFSQRLIEDLMVLQWAAGKTAPSMVAAGALIVSWVMLPMLIQMAQVGYMTTMVAAGSPGGQIFLENSVDFFSNFIEGAEPSPPKTKAGVYGFFIQALYSWYKNERE